MCLAITWGIASLQLTGTVNENERGNRPWRFGSVLRERELKPPSAVGVRPPAAVHPTANAPHPQSQAGEADKNKEEGTARLRNASADRGGRFIDSPPPQL